MSFASIAFWKTAGPALWLAALFLAERLRPAAGAPALVPRLIRNGGLWLAMIAAAGLVGIPLTGLAAAFPLVARPEPIPWPVWLAMDVLILDGWAYFAHRAYHRMPFMWRFHAPHHLDAHLDTTSAGRFHPFEIVLSALIRIPLIMTLGIPFAHALAYDTLLLLAAIFHHSNVRLPDGFERALSRLVVTPAIHWVHHHAVRDDTNSNYSAVFSFWDRLFGTRSSTRRERGMKIGIEGLPDRNLLKLFLAPFESPVR